MEAIKVKGFGAIPEIDSQKTHMQKIDMDFMPTQIFGACNPYFTYLALSADESIGLILPCKVVLRQECDNVIVSIQDPEVMFSIEEEAMKRSMEGFSAKAGKLIGKIFYQG